MASQLYSTIIPVIVEMSEDGMFVLSSPKLPGLLLAGRDVNALYADTPMAIKLLYRVNCGMEVQVAEVADDGIAPAKRPHGLTQMPRSFVALGQRAA